MNRERLHFRVLGCSLGMRVNGKAILFHSGLKCRIDTLSFEICNKGVKGTMEYVGADYVDGINISCLLEIRIVPLSDFYSLLLAFS